MEGRGRKAKTDRQEEGKNRQGRRWTRGGGNQRQGERVKELRDQRGTPDTEGTARPLLAGMTMRVQGNSSHSECSSSPGEGRLGGCGHLTALAAHAKW